MIDRRQGPRAGPGVRGGPEGCPSTTSPSLAKRCAPVPPMPPGRPRDRLGRGAHRRGRRGACGPRAGTGAATRHDRLASRPHRRPVRRLGRRARRRRSLRRAGAGGGSLGSAGRAGARHADSGGCRAVRRRGARTSRPARRPAVARACLAARAGSESRRDHRLHRQDLDQGHSRRAARLGAANRGEPAEPQHRDRPAARGARRARAAPRRWCWRWRCAAPGRSRSWSRSPSQTSA